MAETILIKKRCSLVADSGDKIDGRLIVTADKIVFTKMFSKIVTKLPNWLKPILIWSIGELTGTDLSDYAHSGIIEIPISDIHQIERGKFNLIFPKITLYLKSARRWSFAFISGADKLFAVIEKQIEDYRKNLPIEKPDESDDPNIVLAKKYYQEGDGYRLSNKMDNAIESFTKAIETYPCVDYYWARGYASCIKSSLLDNIQEDMTKVIDSNPNFGAAYFLRGLYFANQKDNKQKAIDDLEKSLELGIGLNGDFAYATGAQENAEDEIAKFKINQLKHGFLDALINT
ncbi:MAG: hypothetical protein Ta2B_09650 [Termitinemataceae bacterium]|nr:MAG: hypothetical protein Ta2B_09650 [Termitinemataceae bacterium]